MFPYLIRRLLLLIPILLGVSLVVFLLMALIPGDTAQAILGPFATEENLAALRADLALDRPLPVQYATWLGNILQGDLGTAHSLNRPVTDEVFERLGATLLLAGTAFITTCLLGLGAGAIMALRQSSWIDRSLTFVVLAGISTPSFALGLVLVLLFAVLLPWFPASGMYSVIGDAGIGDLLAHLVLPTLTLTLVTSAIVARLMRGQMLEVLRQDYVRTARAQGLPERTVLFGHAFRNALVPMIPVLALQAGYLLGGAVYVETIFAWPGIGRAIVAAISTRDVLLAQGCILVVAAGYVVLNLAADILQRWLDPRLNQATKQ
ncbi:MAG: ABC transporter permease [Verrucomicrobiota bacterium]